MCYWYTFSPCFEEQKKIKTECGISTSIYIPEKYQRLVEMNIIILNMMQKWVQVIFTVLELETINCTNLWLPFLDFGTFRGIFGILNQLPKAHSFITAGTCVSFWQYIILLVEIIFVWDIETVGFQRLFREKLPVDRHFISLKLSNVTLK